MSASPPALIPLIDAARIRIRVAAMVDELARDCRKEDLVFIGILHGSFMFLADLVRELDRHAIHPRIDFMILQSYGSGMESSGNVRLVKDTASDVEGRTVVVVDDILDTGRTLQFACAHLAERRAASVRTCVLLDKPARRIAPIRANYVGFEIEDVFVVGYGLDWDHRYRELPYLARVEGG
jgi:hypoxanthine phosphoribosyltransferase